MIKNHYQKELTWNSVISENSNQQQLVTRIQEWINLWYYHSINTGTIIEIDGDFGPITRRAVRKFQRKMNLPITGSVDTDTFSLLSNPIRKAFLLDSYNSSTINNLVIEVATKHFQEKSRELNYSNQSNLGPWVRSYCNGLEGNDYPWCLGFVQAILDISYSKLNGIFTDNYFNTLSCDTFGQNAISNDLLIRHEEIIQNPSLIRRGDLILLRENNETNKWKHTGIITQVIVNDNAIRTIEGNSNSYGSRNGYEVVQRERNFRNPSTGAIDVVKLIF